MSTTQILMPSLGEGVHEATLTKWLKKPGEMVEVDEPLLEISTDKVDTEIPSPCKGYLQVQSANEGDTVKVEQVVAVVGDSPEVPQQQENNTPAPKMEDSQKPPTIADTSPKKEEIKEETYRIDNTRKEKGPAKSSPLVRKIAREKNIDLSNVQGTGLAGRITKKDLDSYVRAASRTASSTLIPGRTNSIAGEVSSPLSNPSTEKNTSPVPITAPPPSTKIDTNHGLATTFVGDQEYLDGVAITREKMSRMRLLIADHMTESVRTSPHVTTVFEMDLHKIVRIREQYKEDFVQQNGFKLTYTHFLLHATVQAIKLHPTVNTSIDGDTLLFKKDINLGCAVAIDGGLIVPVIKNAQDLSLAGIARRMNDLVSRARSKKLNPDDVRGGTFSVTNPGGFGSVISNPIINQPQVAILSIGAIIKKPVSINDAIAVRPMCMIGLTFDHRVIDGEGGAKYLADLKNIIENYNSLPN